MRDPPLITDVVVNMRCRATEIKLIDAASRLMHVTRTAFVRTAAKTEAERVILAFAEQKVTFKE